MGLQPLKFFCAASSASTLLLHEVFAGPAEAPSPLVDFEDYLEEYKQSQSEVTPAARAFTPLGYEEETRVPRGSMDIKAASFRLAPWQLSEEEKANLLSSTLSSGSEDGEMNQAKLSVFILDDSGSMNFEKPGKAKCADYGKKPDTSSECIREKTMCGIYYTDYQLAEMYSKVGPIARTNLANGVPSLFVMLNPTGHPDRYNQYEDTLRRVSEKKAEHSNDGGKTNVNQQAPANMFWNEGIDYVLLQPEDGDEGLARLQNMLRRRQIWGGTFLNTMLMALTEALFPMEGGDEEERGAGTQVWQHPHPGWQPSLLESWKGLVANGSDYHKKLIAGWTPTEIIFGKAIPSPMATATAFLARGQAFANPRTGRVHVTNFAPNAAERGYGWRPAANGAAWVARRERTIRSDLAQIYPQGLRRGDSVVVSMVTDGAARDGHFLWSNRVRGEDPIAQAARLQREQQRRDAEALRWQNGSLASKALQVVTGAIASSPEPVVSPHQGSQLGATADELGMQMTLDSLHMRAQRQGVSLVFVVSLCTEDESEVKFWATVDKLNDAKPKGEGAGKYVLDVIDDQVAEGAEVSREKNPWINYDLGLQNRRLAGWTYEFADYLDERPFSMQEIADFAEKVLPMGQMAFLPPDASHPDGRRVRFPAKLPPWYEEDFLDTVEILNNAARKVQRTTPVQLGGAHNWNTNGGDAALRNEEAEKSRRLVVYTQHKPIQERDGETGPYRTVPEDRDPATWTWAGRERDAIVYAMGPASMVVAGKLKAQESLAHIVELGPYGNAINVRLVNAEGETAERAKGTWNGRVFPPVKSCVLYSALTKDMPSEDEMEKMKKRHADVHAHCVQYGLFVPPLNMVLLRRMWHAATQALRDHPPPQPLQGAGARRGDDAAVDGLQQQFSRFKLCCRRAH